MTTAIVVIIVLLVLAAVAVAVWMRAQQAKRREGLQDRFGPEYDRAVDEHGDRKAAEKQLADTASRRDSIEVRPLQPAERERYAAEWTRVQADFVDSPTAATREADRLVQSVMRDRGYPVDDFDTRSQMLAADHPEVVEHYRAAHSVGSRQDPVDTEDLRQAFVHYRALFELLLDDGRDRMGDRTDTMPAERTDALPADRTDAMPADRTDAMPADRTIATDRPQPRAEETGRDSVDLREEQPRRTT
jgi:type II secretory pathway pseudopilin PulG